MTPALNQYTKRNTRHLLSSRINTYSKRTNLNLVCATTTLRSSNKWAAFIYWYIKFTTTLSVRKYFLSSSQKKYQTVSLNAAILEQEASKRTIFVDTLNYFHTEVFPDQLKQTYEHTLSIQKNKVYFHIAELPFNIYNQQSIFQQIFSSGTQGISFVLKGNLHTLSTPTVLFLFLYYKCLGVQVD